MRAYIALVKWRNQLLALFCLLAFAGLGVLYFQHWVIRKPFGIILFIGEGLAPGRLAPTRAYAGGAAQFLPSDKVGERQDGRDLLLELRRNGFDIVRTRAELEAIPAWRRPKLFGAFSNIELAFANQVEERSQQPSLPDMVRRAIELLQYNAGGYLLVVDAGLMRKAAEENNGERTLSETVELDRAVSVARRYAGQRSTIVVCGDAAIGGLSLNGFPFRKDSGIALLGFNSAGQPWITWATGPNGDKSYGAAKIPGKEYENQNRQPQPEQPEPAAFYTKSALVTVEDVIAFGNGPGTDALAGVVESTKVFEILRDEL